MHMYLMRGDDHAMACDEERTLHADMNHCFTALACYLAIALPGFALVGVRVKVLA